jgi:hypothetical protein
MKRQLLSILLLGAVNMASAAIIYTDITDVNLTAGGTETYGVDFDQDVAAEFSIDINTMDIALQAGATGGTHAFVGANVGGFEHVSGLAFNDAISSASTYTATGIAFLEWAMASLTFPSGSDQYVGCHFELGANTHYGWIRVNMTAWNDVTILDFAYNDTPDAAIDAGEMPVSGLTDLALNDLVSIYPNPAVDQLTIDLSKLTGNSVAVQLIDITGKVIYATSNLSSTTQIDLSSFNRGVYFLTIKEGEETTTYKVIKK